MDITPLLDENTAISHGFLSAPSKKFNPTSMMFESPIIP
jgi:hypothetical protein